MRMSQAAAAAHFHLPAQSAPALHKLRQDCDTVTSLTLSPWLCQFPRCRKRFHLESGELPCLPTHRPTPAVPHLHRHKPCDTARKQFPPRHNSQKLRVQKGLDPSAVVPISPPSSKASLSPPADRHRWSPPGSRKMRVWPRVLPASRQQPAIVRR